MTQKSNDVAMIMGSQSDWSTMRHAAETLDALGSSHEDLIVSAAWRMVDQSDWLPMMMATSLDFWVICVPRMERGQ